jgi:ATP-dependent Clp protease ATP-binding subunit ClpA
MFAPEFRNRLDAWIAFEPLAFETIKLVVDKFIGELQAQLAGKNVTLELREPARDWLATNGYDPKFGARPMARLISTKIKQPLVDAILFGKLAEGGHVVVDAEGNELKLAF